MLISYSRRFAFIHVPKTAGSSVYRALAPYGDVADGYWANRWLARIGIHVNHYAPHRLKKFRPHTTAETLRRNLPPEVFESLFKFAFVRDPWSLLVSYYHFIRDSGRHHRRMLAITLGSFEDFVAYETRRRRVSQTALLAGRDGRILVDFVGRYESLDSDFAFICRQIGIASAPLGHFNATAHRDHREYYDARLARLVRDAYAEDIERFGYEFADPTVAPPAGRLTA